MVPGCGTGNHEELLRGPVLAHFGIPSPSGLAGIALRYQIAQKLHACTDSHAPPEDSNDRVRDVVDLVLLHELVTDEGQLGLADRRQACVHL
jgi:hypothetical protein